MILVELATALQWVIGSVHYARRWTDSGRSSAYRDQLNYIIYIAYIQYQV